MVVGFIDVGVGVGVTAGAGGRVEDGAVDEFAFCCAPVRRFLVPFYSLDRSRGVFLLLGGFHWGVWEANDFAAFGQGHEEERDARGFEFVVVRPAGGCVAAFGTAVGG